MPAKMIAKKMFRAALVGGMIALFPAVQVGLLFFGMFALGLAPLGGEGFRDIPPPSPLTVRDYLVLGIPVFLVLGGAVIMALVGVGAIIQHAVAKGRLPTSKSGDPALDRSSGAAGWWT